MIRRGVVPSGAAELIVIMRESDWIIEPGKIFEANSNKKFQNQDKE